MKTDSRSYTPCTPRPPPARSNFFTASSRLRFSSNSCFVRRDLLQAIEIAIGIAIGIGVDYTIDPGYFDSDSDSDPDEPTLGVMSLSVRIIPTCVGKSAKRSGIPRRAADHPHVRGEKVFGRGL